MMNNQINFQPIHCHHINIQGYQVKQLQSPCHMYTSSPSYSSNRYPQIQSPQNIQTTIQQLNQGFETSPSSRFLSTTAKVLKNQITEFKQMMTQQQQQNNFIKNTTTQDQQNQKYIQGHALDLQRSHIGKAQIYQPYSQQKSGTPQSSSTSSNSSYQRNQINQGFGIVLNNYQRSNSANQNGKQNKIQHDSMLPLTTYNQFTNPDQYKTHGGDHKDINLLNNKTGVLPLQVQNPTFAKQTQKCTNYFVSQTQPSEIEFIERRLSIPNDNREEIERQSTRFSDDIKHTFSDSIQSISINPISLTSNYSPLLIGNDIHIRNSIQSIINQPLQLDSQVHEQLEQIQNEYLKQVQSQSKNNDVIVIQDQCRTQKLQDNQQKENNFLSPHLQNDSNSLLSQQLINLYLHKGSNDEIEVGEHVIQLLSSRQKSENNLQVDNIKEQNLNKLNDTNKILKSNEQNENNIIEQNIISKKKEEKPIKIENNPALEQNTKNLTNLNSQQQKKTPSKQNTGSNQNIQINIDLCQKNKIKNINSSTSEKIKLNQKQFFVDDREIKTPYSPKEQYQNNIDKNKLGMNRRHSNEKQNKIKNSKNEKIHQNLQSNEKNGNSSPFIINLCKQTQETSKKSSSKKNLQKDQKVNDLRMFNTPKQVMTNKFVQNNAILQEYQMEVGNQNNYTPHRAYNYSSCKSNQIQTENMSASRQITFPESPISIPSKFDFSCGFGSDITYNEDIVQESVREYAQNQKKNILPLVTTISQIQNEQNQNNENSTSHKQNILDQKNLNVQINSQTKILEENKLNGKFDVDSNQKVQVHINNQQFQCLDKDNRILIENKLFCNNIQNQVNDQLNNEQINDNYQKDHFEDDEENGVHPNFINLYKTPLKNYRVDKNENSNKQQELKQTTIHKNAVYQELEKIENSPLYERDIQGNIIRQANENNYNNEMTRNTQNIIVQEQFQDANNNQKQYNVKSQNKIDIENTENNNLKQSEDQFPYLIEMQKQKQIAEVNKQQNKLDKFIEQSQIRTNSSESKIPLSQQNSKQLIARRKIKNEKESIQSIHELLNFMGGILPVSQFCTPLPTNNLLTKQNLSLVFDDKSFPPSKVCSLKYIASEGNNQADQIEEQNHNINLLSQQKSQQNKINTNLDQYKKENNQKRQETPSKYHENHQQQKINQNEKKQGAPLKLQDFYTGQYQGIKQQNYINNQKIDNNLNKYKKQQKPTTITDKQINNKKLESQIEEGNKTECSKIKSQQKNNSQNNYNRGENKNITQKNNCLIVGITGNSISQKSLQNKLDHRSINQEKDKSSTTFQNSSIYNSSVSTTVKNANTQKSVGSSHGNFISKAMDGNILADSLLKSNEDLQSQIISQKEDSSKGLNQSTKFQANNSQANSQTNGKKQFSNRASFEIIQNENQDGNQPQINQLIGQYYDDEKEQPYIKLGQPPNHTIKEAIIVEDIYQDSSKKKGIQDEQCQQDTVRIMKCENQSKKENQLKQKNKQQEPLRKQSSLHEKSQKDTTYVINLDKGRNSVSNNNQNKTMTRSKEIDSSKSPNKNVQNNIQFFEFKIDKKSLEQNTINLRLKNQQQYSIQKQKSNHEIRQRPKSTQKGTIHNSTDKSVQDLFASTDKIISVDQDNKKKMLTSNSPIIYNKNKKGISNYQLSSNSNKKEVNFHNQFASYSSTNHFKNYYQVGINKTISQSNYNEMYTHSFTQLLNNNQQSSSFQTSQKQQPGVYNLFSNLQKMQSQKKEDSINSPQKIYNLDK